MEILLVLLVNGLSQFLKKFIAPRFGEFGVLATVALISLVIGLGYYLTQVNESAYIILQEGTKIMLWSVGLYEVILKRVMPTVFTQTKKW